jgi:hypothetical protein
MVTSIIVKLISWRGVELNYKSLDIELW